MLEEPEGSRVRVTVRTHAPRRLRAESPGQGDRLRQQVVHTWGETDLRGVFVAEGVRGQVTAVARKGSNQYAFHRGTTPVGPPQAAPNAPGQQGQNQPGQPGQNPPGQPAAGWFDLQQNVRGQNTSNQERQLQRLEERYKPQDQGVKAKSAY